MFTKLFLILFSLQCVQVVRPSTLQPGSVLKLYWVPNNAGLFSQFLQLKIMAKHASEIARELIVVPTSSPHYGSKTINMCDIFMLPYNVTCAPLPPGMYCEKNFKKIHRAHESQDACYIGTIAFNTDIRVRTHILNAVQLSTKFQFTEKYVAFANKFQEQLERIACTRTASMGCAEGRIPFAVVHWRRGDQLTGRCVKNVDASVNCADAPALVQRVNALTGNELVYVATNEPQQSEEMEHLRSQGFVTFDDVLQDSAALSGEESSDLFMVLAAETSLMLNATTFLGWGISEINDVVEHERMLAGRSFCLDQPAPVEETQHNWCTMFGRQHSPQHVDSQGVK